MTIDQIVEIISPYFTVAGVTALVTALVSIAAKVYGTVKKTGASLSKTAMLNEEKIVELMSKVLPKDMAVKIMPLVESELQKINEAVQKAAGENAKKVAAKLDSIAKAVASMRNLPSEQREKLLDMIDAENQDVEPQMVTVEYEVSEEIKALADESSGSNDDFKPTIY